MLGAVKLALAGGLCAVTIPVLAAPRVVPQDPAPAVRQAPFYQESSWNLAVLQYTNARGDVVEVPARLLTRVWLLKTPEGRLRMEILYENRDYTSVDIRDFSIIRSSPGNAAVDVPIVRASIDGMAFPGFK